MNNSDHRGQRVYEGSALAVLYLAISKHNYEFIVYEHFVTITYLKHCYMDINTRQNDIIGSQNKCQFIDNDGKLNYQNSFCQFCATNCI